MLKWSELSARQRNELVAGRVVGLKRGVIAAGDYTLEVWDGKLLPDYSQEIARVECGKE